MKCIYLIFLTKKGKNYLQNHFKLGNRDNLECFESSDDKFIILEFEDES